MQKLDLEEVEGRNAPEPEQSTTEIANSANIEKPQSESVVKQNINSSNSTKEEKGDAEESVQ